MTSLFMVILIAVAINCFAIGAGAVYVYLLLQKHRQMAENMAGLHTFRSEFEAVAKAASESNISIAHKVQDLQDRINAISVKSSR